MSRGVLTEGPSPPAAAVQLVAANPGSTSLLLGPCDVTELDQDLAWLATPVPTDPWAELVEEGRCRSGGHRPPSARP